MDIKETIKKDIEHIFNKLEKLRTDELPWTDNKELDFKPYRSMASCLIDTFNNYKFINNHLIATDNEFIRNFINKLEYEIKKLHEIIEVHKEGYQQFKSLNDAFIKLTRLLQNIKEDICNSFIKSYKEIHEQKSNKCEKIKHDSSINKLEIEKQKYEKRINDKLKAIENENVSDKINVMVDCKLDKKGIENFQKELKSYDIGKEFNYAVAIIKVLIANGEDHTDNTNEILGINIVTKVQYIVPFVSKELAEKYLEELSVFKKMTMFIPVDEDGKLVVKDYNVENTMNEYENKAMYNDNNLSIEKYLFLLAKWLKTANDEHIDNYLTDIFGLKFKNTAKEFIKEIHLKCNVE